MKRGAFVTACLLLAIGFAALGVWQLERRAWKLDLIARIEARVHAAAQPLPRAWRGDLTYRRVRATGVYLQGRDTRVQAVTALGAGWWVMTPLRTGAQIVLVNRGFVPADFGATPPPAGTVTVIGLLRASEPGGGFLRANNSAADRWYSRDTAAIARARRIGFVPPWFIDAEATPAAGYPVGGLTVIAFRNAHLTYALTWFALAGMSAAGAVLASRRR